MHPTLLAPVLLGAIVLLAVARQRSSPALMSLGTALSIGVLVAWRWLAAISTGVLVSVTVLAAVHLLVWYRVHRP